MTFYDRFHSDSSFQDERIRYPLDVKTLERDRKKEWTREDLPMLKTRVFDVDTSKYEVQYTRTDTSFYQKVWLEDSGFSTESRFKLIGNRWFLVYYMDHNL